MVSPSVEEQGIQEQSEIEVENLKKTVEVLTAERDNLLLKIKLEEAKEKRTYVEGDVRRLIREELDMIVKDRMDILVKTESEAQKRKLTTRGKKRPELAVSGHKVKVGLPPRPSTSESLSAADHSTRSVLTKKESSDENSTEPDRREIRIQATKVLLKASHSLCRLSSHSKTDSVSTFRTNASKISIGTHTTLENKENSPKTSGKTLKYPKGGDDQSSVCSLTSVRAQDPAHVDFFLPKIEFTCKCEDCSERYRQTSCDLTALSNILRGWQAKFLASVGIKTTEELIRARQKDSRGLSKAMVKWRSCRNMRPVKKKSCYVALHIWTRTASAVAKSIRLNPDSPQHLSILCESDSGSVSTLGCSVGGMTETGMMEV
mmetsp:Transcript_37889/g.55830  ORF Transcript_37889/g.55830 Transcript_37889/m.55830 type:complete len:375 (-) Transcript_37889:175-1299(-)|eukprot:CAMPEP_0195507284 /NCGR_PEP_ID=MMETSP0794_2-20130614/761_1 /TAXON_ID=515487 /ORGANISM="Stephanopyxis turris, Strain CCMP 815" /LENGTH=374 /DNA_ID=CAMNT_0040633917 /DNA_START=145 /DNA_END=1269 /DNA_ORIENTATION=-